MINISHDDAVAYCAWLSDATGRPYHLPTEAQWEYACRAGTTTRFSFGDEITKQEANFNWNISKQLSAPVGSYPANPWGLHEMHGNVAEWCADAWHESYEGAPDDDSAWINDETAARVVRGGSCSNFARFGRSAYRSSGSPGDDAFNLQFIGFRCAGVQEES